jgi:hypothetical protein
MDPREQASGREERRRESGFSDLAYEASKIAGTGGLDLMISTDHHRDGDRGYAGPATACFLQDKPAPAMQSDGYQRRMFGVPTGFMLQTLFKVDVQKGPLWEQRSL